MSVAPAPAVALALRTLLTTHPVEGLMRLVFLEAPAEVETMVLGFLKACQAGNVWSRRASERGRVEVG